MIKNIEKAQVLTLKEQVAYQAGQVVSKTLAQNDALSVGSPLTASTMSFMRASPSLCPPVTLMRCSVRSSSRCCW